MSEKRSPGQRALELVTLVRNEVASARAEIRDLEAALVELSRQQAELAEALRQQQEQLANGLQALQAQLASGQRSRPDTKLEQLLQSLSSELRGISSQLSELLSASRGG